MFIVGSDGNCDTGLYLDHKRVADVRDGTKRSESVARHLWRVIADWDIHTVFGLPGTTNLAALEELRRRDNLRFVVTRHEQCAGHMADASARMFAPFGVALVDLGPGLANTMTAVLAAARDSSPLLLIAGNEERWLIGREVWHEMPEIETFRALTKFAVRVNTAGEFPMLLRRAIRTAISGRPGPVLLSVPKDVWDEEVALPGGLNDSGRIARPSADLDAVTRTADALRRARRPLIVAGGGARRAAISEVLAQLCSRFGLAVVTSPNGRGVLPEDHPHCLGHAGRFGQRQASRTLQEADLLLVLGCRLDDLTTHSWKLLSLDQKIIQVDTEPTMIGRNWPVELAVTADAKSFIGALLDCLGESSVAGWDLSSRVTERKSSRAAFYDIADDRLVKPQAVMGALQRQIRAAHTLVMGGGRFQQFVGEWLVRAPENFFYAANSGTVGFALSAAIGVAIEHPSRQVLCCLGDGDFMMHVQELETAVREGAAVKCVVFNDFAYGAMKARQTVSFGTEYSNPDFAELARAFGAGGRTLTMGADSAAAITWLLEEKGTAVLDVRMDAAESRSLMFGHDIGDKVD